MASIKISGLTEQTTASDTDLLPVASSAGMAKRMTLANFVTWLASKLNSKFAPAGYGLGGWATTVNDFNNAVATGWYSTANTSTLNSPFAYALVEVIKRNDNQIIQLGYDSSESVSTLHQYGASAIRRYEAGVWGEWEYINPPMEWGVEYHTTERYRGKVVYTKLLNFGNLPNSNTLNYGIGLGLNLISIDGFASNDTYILPLTSSPYVEIYYNKSTGNLGITTTKDLSSYTWHAVIKYIKG